eukprot:TRINITY_DN74345_c0_g1_i1.p1 TRINITY_DN74345_c0_g1~~TRINITY_DN74345_c0_g1_i1.p1  ORF type:complete len:816 (-),score=115.02 TRINITY_DN74345_c0_g1_i1:120-2444(-)
MAATSAVSVTAAEEDAKSVLADEDVAPSQVRVPRARSVDWPLSREEKRSCILNLYDRDLRAANDLVRTGEDALQTLRSELRLIHAANHVAASERRSGRACLQDGLADGAEVTDALAPLPNGTPPSSPESSQEVNEGTERLRMAINAAAATLSSLLESTTVVGGHRRQDLNVESYTYNHSGKRRARSTGTSILNSSGGVRETSAGGLRRDSRKSSRDGRPLRVSFASDQGNDTDDEIVSPTHPGPSPKEDWTSAVSPSPGCNVRKDCCDDAYGDCDYTGSGRHGNESPSPTPSGEPEPESESVERFGASESVITEPLKDSQAQVQTLTRSKAQARILPNIPLLPLPLTSQHKSKMRARELEADATNCTFVAEKRAEAESTMPVVLTKEIEAMGTRHDGVGHYDMVVEWKQRDYPKLLQGKWAQSLSPSPAPSQLRTQSDGALLCAASDPGDIAERRPLIAARRSESGCGVGNPGRREFHGGGRGVALGVPRPDIWHPNVSDCFVAESASDNDNDPASSSNACGSTDLAEQSVGALCPRQAAVESAVDPFALCGDDSGSGKSATNLVHSLATCSSESLRPRHAAEENSTATSSRVIDFVGADSGRHRIDRVASDRTFNGSSNGQGFNRIISTTSQGIGRMMRSSETLQPRRDSPVTSTIASKSTKNSGPADSVGWIGGVTREIIARVNSSGSGAANGKRCRRNAGPASRSDGALQTRTPTSALGDGNMLRSQSNGGLVRQVGGQPRSAVSSTDASRSAVRQVPSRSRAPASTVDFF